MGPSKHFINQVRNSERLLQNEPRLHYIEYKSSEFAFFVSSSQDKSLTLTSLKSLLKVSCRGLKLQEASVFERKVIFYLTLAKLSLLDFQVTLPKNYHDDLSSWEGWEVKM